MKLNKIIILVISLLFISCDPENDYYISGKVINSKTKVPIENVEIKEISEFRNIKNETLKTNRNGIFNDTIYTLRAFDSIKYKISKIGYLTKEINIKKENWNKKINFSIMKKEYEVDFGKIEMDIKRTVTNNQYNQ